MHRGENGMTNFVHNDKFQILVQRCTHAMRSYKNQRQHRHHHLEQKARSGKINQQKHISSFLSQPLKRFEPIKRVQHT